MTTTENPFETDVELDEIEEVPQAAPEAVAAEAKPTKATKPKPPEGYITPVEFAHKLTERLRAEGRLGEHETIPPQMIYSYVKQGRAEGAKNPLRSYREGGRDNLLKPEEAMSWWDAKEERKAAREAEKAAKAKAATESVAAPAAPQEAVVEAE